MKKHWSSIFILTALVFLSDEAWPSAVIVKRQQMQEQQKKAYQQALRQKAAQQVLQQQAYQQAMEQKRAVLQKAVEDNRAQTVPRSLAGATTLKENFSESIEEPVVRHTVSRYQEEEAASPKEDEVNLEHIWKELEISSEIWPLIIDLEPKEITVGKYIKDYEEQGVAIRKTPIHYVYLIDGMYRDNPTLFKQPFKDILKLAAILEYDFDTGEDKDLLARKFLGEKLYQENRQRLQQR